MRLPAPGADSRVAAKLQGAEVRCDGGMMTIDERLVELLMDAEDRCRQGRPLVVEELCPESPDLWPALHELLSGVGRVDRLLNPVDRRTGLTESLREDAANRSPVVLPEIPDFEIKRELGRGGMGEVYEAYQRSLNRHVAIKFLPDRGDLARFRREAKAAGRLHHTNIVPVFGIGEYHGRHFYVMQYIQGRGLDAVVERRAAGGNALGSTVPPDFREVASVGAQVAEALAYAHAQGVLHRDIKPSNLLLDERGTVWITDFGLAKDASDASTLTETGDVLGTLRYLAPERVSGRADARTDIYGLGASLYELICARPAFMNPDRAVLLHQVLHHEPPRPRSIEPQVPLDLETIVLKAMARGPEERYATAAALAEDCRRFLEDRPIRARRAGVAERMGRWCRRNRTVAVMLAAVLMSLASMAGLAGVGYLRESNLHAVAESERELARAAELKAKDEATRSSRLFYIANMNVARQDWDAGNIRHLREILAETESHPERGFEWDYWRRMSHRDSTIFRGHTGAVSAVAISRDGQKLATASTDGTARVWDATTGRERLTLSAHAAGVRAVAFAPDGTALVTSGGDGTVQAWNADSGKLIRAYAGHHGAVNAVAFLPDGARIVTAGDDRTVRAWDFATGRLLLTMADHQGAVRALAVSSNGKMLATGGDDARVRLWDTATGRVLSHFTGDRQFHEQPVTGVAFSLDGGSLLVSSSLDGIVRTWNVADGDKREIIKDSAWAINSISYLADWTRIVWGGADGIVRIRTMSDIEELIGHTGSILALSVSPNGRDLVTGGSDATARLWNFSGPQPIACAGPPHSYTFDAVAVSADGGRVASGGLDGVIKIWDAATGVEQLTFRGHAGGIKAVAFAPGGRALVTAGADGMAQSWETKTGRLIRAYSGHVGSINAVAFSIDGARFVTAGDDGTARIWETDTGRPIRILRGHKGAILAVAFSSKERQILTGGSDWTARVWDEDTGRVDVVLEHGHGVTAVAFSPDGSRIATASWDRAATVWDAGTGVRLIGLSSHRNWIKSISFSPDGQRILTSGLDEDAKVSDAITGREVLSLRHPHLWGTLLSGFFPDGRRILTSIREKALIWEAGSVDRIVAWDDDERAAQSALRATIRARTDRQEELGFIHDWLVLAPIHLDHGQSGSEALDHEQVTDEARLWPRPGDRIVVNNQDLTWNAVRQTDYFVDFGRLAGPRTFYAVAYAICYLESEAEQTGLCLGVGSDEQSKVYLNGQEVFATRATRSLEKEPDANAAYGVTLRKGVNSLVLKVVNETAGWRGSVRLADRDGHRARGVRTRTAP
jgi:eukaryotic-like serine/threonine-protein kinase